MKNLLITGIGGKVGKYVYELASDYSFNVVCGIDKQKLLDIECPVYSGFDEIRENLDVIVDFSSDTLCREACLYALKNNCAFLTGTTALTEKTLKAIESASTEIAVCKASNYSKAVLTMEKIAKIARESLPDFDAQIIEVHHSQKKDKPSGTAKRIGELTGIKEIHSLRGGDTPGIHTVIMSGNGEEMVITHRSYNKSVFARGALQAAQKLLTKAPGLYAAENLL